MKLYVLVESTKWGNSVYAYDTEQLRAKQYKNLVDGYIEDYGRNFGKNIETIEDLTFDDCSIDMYEVNLNEY